MTKKTVFFDANILFSWNMNHLLMFYCDSQVGLIEPYWSEEVITEAIRNIVKAYRADEKNVEARFVKMNEAYPYAKVTGYNDLADIIGVDPKDQHVAKAALHNECEFLVTENLKDFKNGNFLGASLKPVTPDTLLTALLKKHFKESMNAVVLAWWHRKPEVAFADYLGYLDKSNGGLGLKNFVAAIKSEIKVMGFEEDKFADFCKKSLSRSY